MVVEHNKVESPPEDLMEELQSAVPNVAGVTVVSSTEPDGTQRTDVKVDYVESPTDAEKRGVEDVLEKRGLK